MRIWILKKRTTMKPKNFKEANVTFAANQPGYKPLPAFKNVSPDGEVVSCWNLTFRERLRVLFKGEIWLCLLSFNKPLTPSFMTTQKSEVLSINEYGNSSTTHEFLV